MFMINKKKNSQGKCLRALRLACKIDERKIWCWIIDSGGSKQLSYDAKLPKLLEEAENSMMLNTKRVFMGLNRYYHKIEQGGGQVQGRLKHP